ncbi:MAG: glycosyltransferase family 2 protein [Candidatus Dependentiae bacterium]
MNRFKLSLHIACMLFFTLSTYTKHFVIVIPSYNNKEWYQKNLDSVFMQQHTDFELVYIADCPTDGTDTLVENYFKAINSPIKTTLIKNKERVGALANLYNTIAQCDPSHIIVTLDGDDWFPDEKVLTHLNHIYSHNEVWMTYGQSLHHPSNRIGGARQIPNEVIAHNSYRSYDWVATHLRTFYAGLFQRIAVEDLMYEGEFFSVAWDLAFMFPMLEMAGIHSYYIDRIMYVYNCNNPISDFRIAAQKQAQYDRYIRTKKPYEPLEYLFN